MLTRRGWAFVGVAVGAFLMAGWFSARSLNAVAAPLLVALAAGYVHFKRVHQPELRTETPDYGFAGETATVSLQFDAETPLAATVRLEADDGLHIEDGEVETTVADEAVTFGVGLEDRGFQSVGPVEVVAEDVFGVWATVYTYPVNAEIVVFPKIHRLDDASDLAVLHRDFGLDGRDRFDQLREYERGRRPRGDGVRRQRGAPAGRTPRGGRRRPDGRRGRSRRQRRHLPAGVRTRGRPDRPRWPGRTQCRPRAPGGTADPVGQHLPGVGR
ncbi:hypothetical protein BRD15_09990 [Halobacteriales archaeon SW_6_65_15]|nr:MAG: hypothetical protein BRD15_09990 [Halobacteriales archaeon SW_6_65_15]